jgi:hypothetical protein
MTRVGWIRVRARVDLYFDLRSINTLGSLTSTT